MARISQTVKIEGSGQGPSLGELKQFVELFGDDYHTQIRLSVTKAMDQRETDQWSLSGNYTS